MPPAHSLSHFLTFSGSVQRQRSPYGSKSRPSDPSSLHSPLSLLPPSTKAARNPVRACPMDPREVPGRDVTCGCMTPLPSSASKPAVLKHCDACSVGADGSPPGSRVVVRRRRAEIQASWAPADQTAKREEQLYCAPANISGGLGRCGGMMCKATWRCHSRRSDRGTCLFGTSATRTVADDCGWCYWCGW